MRKTIAVHVRNKSLYISLSSSAKQQREMTNSALPEERELRRLVFLRRNPIVDGAISGFSGQKSVPE